MIANPNPNISAGMMRAEIDFWRDDNNTPEFLVLIEPRDNPLITLLQVAKLHTVKPWQGVDVTVGDVPDESQTFMAFTYTGSRDSFWDGLMRLTEAVIMAAMEIDDDRLPGQRAYARMLRDFELPPLHLLPEITIDDDGEVCGDPAWKGMM
ncbi:hypothetical protein [Corynebacterium sp. HMSC055D05]|uniref:hypothetical protein n=1 Tax=Corynebacterium sp. HMSC055D05 TaxID=1715213 RepID=UPI0008A386A2|nr:hypothetical protein [Corynebacterium sp. HMSC055D05]OFL91432.1 hypothetical protein HMPREF2734_11115 [Corynebacterium sp. HMSC055D05]